MKKQTHNCPICNKELKPIKRYPNYICYSCAERAADEHGNKLSFNNVAISGGFEAFYYDTKEIYDSHTCYIDGIKCYSDEARIGGIVIQVVKKE